MTWEHGAFHSPKTHTRPDPSSMSSHSQSAVSDLPTGSPEAGRFLGATLALASGRAEGSEGSGPTLGIAAAGFFCAGPDCFAAGRFLTGALFSLALALGLVLGSLVRFSGSLSIAMNSSERSLVGSALASSGRLPSEDSVAATPEGPVATTPEESAVCSAGPTALLGWSLSWFNSAGAPVGSLGWSLAWFDSAGTWTGSLGWSLSWFRSAGTWTGSLGWSLSWFRSAGTWTGSLGWSLSWFRSAGTWTGSLGWSLTWFRTAGTWTASLGWSLSWFASAGTMTSSLSGDGLGLNSCRQREPGSPLSMISSIGASNAKSKRESLRPNGSDSGTTSGEFRVGRTMPVGGLCHSSSSLPKFIWFRSREACDRTASFSETAMRRDNQNDDLENWYLLGLKTQKVFLCKILRKTDKAKLKFEDSGRSSGNLHFSTLRMPTWHRRRDPPAKLFTKSWWANNIDDAQQSPSTSTSAERSSFEVSTWSCWK